MDAGESYEYWDERRRHLFDLMRALGGGGGGDDEGPAIDYTVLSVAVTTLGLLLIVELLRHKIDQAATGREFFKTVLEGVYRELATLGIVEAVVYIMHLYWENLNYEMEQVFARVHFTFFFTAIFNAFQSAILAIIAVQISKKIWVQTEELQLNHYIAIREEYDRVEAKLEKMSSRGYYPHDSTAQDVYQCNMKSLRRLCKAFSQYVRYPALKRRQRKLLVQVRFHELRIHFLNANHLPLKFKVSEYLMQSELHVFKKLVHVSTFAWLSLMAATTLIYFLMGMVASVHGNNTVGAALTGIYLGYCILFVLIALVIYQRMTYIFSQIMHKKLIDTTVNEEDENDQTNEPSNDYNNTTRASQGLSGTVQRPFRKRRHGRPVTQLELFWGSDPHLVIGTIQFMQFGYAIAMAYLLVFWEVLDVSWATVEAKWFAVTSTVCYLAFAIIIGNVMPRYTLCTSLGQLVNRRRLNDCFAKYRLEEARRKRKYLLEEKAVEQSLRLLASEKAAKSKPTDTKWFLGQSKRNAAGPKDEAGSEKGSYVETRKMEKLAELVATDTKDLPDLGPAPKTADARKTRRQARMRSLSDGVASMRLFGSGMSGAASSTLGSNDDDDDDAKRSIFEPPGASDAAPPVTRKRGDRPRRKKTVSDLGAMRNPVSSLFSTTDKKEAEVEEDTRAGPPMRKSTSNEGLTTLVEDIPVRSVRASELIVPLGRGSLEDYEKQAAGFVDSDEPSPAAVSESARDDSVSTLSIDREKCKGVTLGDDDDATVNTAESGGGGSDLDDVPEVSPEKCVKQEQPDEHLMLGDRIRSFLDTHKYRLFSGIFGTIVCFFLIGMRVEVLNIKTGRVDDDENTWHIADLKTVFYWEVSWLGMFVCMSMLTMFLFRPRSCSPKRYDMVWAGGLDIMLSGLCLGLLMWSEVERCCSEQVTNYDCCSSFGSRIYGGIGNIEPFTSLIVLRVLRFSLGRRIVKTWNVWKGTHKKKRRPPVNTGSIAITRRPLDARKRYSSGSLSPYDFDEAHHGDSHHSSSADEAGTIEELWRRAIIQYPKIVEKYGDFSGELLQTMLGIEVIEEGSEPDMDHFDSMHSGSIHITSDSENNGTSPAPVASKIEAHDIPDQAHGSRPPPPMELSRRFQRLPAATQSIILAGRTGKPVKTVSQASANSNSLADDGSDYTQFATQSYSGDSGHGVELTPSPPNKQPTPVAPMQFDFDREKAAEEKLRDDYGQEPNDLAIRYFINPNARLIRSMKRCERRLPPILNHWAVVDVVLTKYELVYFDASHVDEDMEELIDEECLDERDLRLRRQTVREAIVATKGGKGLRLRDVAVGRKVVGHLELDTVDLIHVERQTAMGAHDPPTPDDDNKSRASISSFGSGRGHKQVAFEQSDDCHVFQDEYWKLPSKSDSAYISTVGKNCTESRNHRWELVNEDRLKIHSLQGTLCLRFYADLDDAEIESQHGETEIKKNDAFLWCQTIARLCGSEQLRQKLPHFGEEGRAELEDFLVVVDRGHNDVPGIKTRNKMKAKIRGRLSISPGTVVPPKALFLLKDQSVHSNKSFQDGTSSHTPKSKAPTESATQARAGSETESRPGTAVRFAADVSDSE